MENNLSFRGGKRGGEPDRVKWFVLAICGSRHYTRGVNVDRPIFGEGGFWSSVTNGEILVSNRTLSIHQSAHESIISYLLRMYSWKENLAFDTYFSLYTIIIIIRHADLITLLRLLPLSQLKHVTAFLLKNKSKID